VILKGTRTVDGRNPAPVDMVQILFEYPIYNILWVLYIPGGCLGFLPSTILKGILLGQPEVEVNIVPRDGPQVDWFPSNLYKSESGPGDRGAGLVNDSWAKYIMQGFFLGNF